MSLSERHKRYLHTMGIQAWESRQAPEPEPEIPVSDAAAAPKATGPAPEVPRTDIADSGHSAAVPVHAMDWQRLEYTVRGCQACALHESRTQAVFGVGDRRAQWMIIGEAPGADEDRQGEPFVGRAGKLLNNMLVAMGLGRDQVYIANILKCRPPNNRDPRPEEVVQCERYLQRQVQLIEPAIILAVGRVAAQNLLKTDNSLSRLRGKTFHYGPRETPLIVTYHPAYLLRSPQEKRKAWQDLQYAMRIYNMRTED